MIEASMNEQTAKRAPGHTGIWRWIPSILIGVALIVVVTHFSEQERFVKLLGNVRPTFLLLAVLLQAATYFCEAGSWHVAVRAFNEKISLRALAWLSLSKLFIDQAVPSFGLSGILMTTSFLRKRGVPSGAIALGVVGKLIGYYISYLLLFLFSTVALWSYEQNPVFRSVTFIFAIFAVFIGLLAFFLWRSIRKGRASFLRMLVEGFAAGRLIIKEIQELPSSVLTRSLLTRMIGYHLGIFLLDAGTLYVLLYGLGTPQPFVTTIAVFIFSSAITSLAITPGGIGVFEGGSTAFLTILGVPLEAAFAATILLRGLTFWLPMVPGLLITRHEFNRPHIDEQDVLPVDA